MFDSFPSLKYLYLSENNIYGALPNSLARPPIKKLWLNNQKRGLSASIDVLSNMTHLYEAWLSYNVFSGAIPDLRNCTSLFDLQLRNNFLSGVVPPSLPALSSLQMLSLEFNMLRGPLPAFGKGVIVTSYPMNLLCPHSDDGLCDQAVLVDIAEAFGNSDSLQLTNSWRWDNPCENWSFIACAQGKVTAVKLARQGLTGTISPEFADLTYLRDLDLSDNYLTGSIPESLTTLSQLEALDVSYNNLSGVVPKFRSSVRLNTKGNVLLQSSEGRGTPNHGWIAGILDLKKCLMSYVCFC